MEKTTVVCPVDFTEISSKALDYASIFAQKMKGELMILHVIDKKTSASAESSGTPFSTPGSFDKMINDKLELLRNDIGQKNSITVRSRIEYGNLDDVVPLIAQEKETALIVMGTSGAKGIKDIFQGTNTIKVMEKTFCPILIIPEDAEFTIPNYWVYATDLKSRDESSAAEIWKLCSLFDGKLDLLHVEKDSSKKDMEIFETQSLKDDSGEDKISLNTIKHKDILKGIDQYVGEKDPDILALTHHVPEKWDWLFKEDKINKVVENANFPILVIHE